MPHIVKIGLAVMRNGRVLLARKRGLELCILPGGKPETGESDEAALVREIDEELGCGIETGSLTHLGDFTDRAAGKPDTLVTVRLYAGRLVGEPVPRNEIEGLVWLGPEDAVGGPVKVAPSLERQILPFLFRR